MHQIQSSARSLPTFDLLQAVAEATIIELKVSREITGQASHDWPSCVIALVIENPWLLFEKKQREEWSKIDVTIWLFHIAMENNHH